MTRRRGFTIIELLVAIAILGILVALLVPAVQQAREAARRASCRNNLRQIGIALHGYHDVHGILPPGEVFINSYDGFNWMAYVLPYLDQAPLYEQIGPNGRDHVKRDYFAEHGTIIPGGDTVLPVFRCPSSLMPSHSQSVGPVSVPPYGIGYAVSDYRGSNGIGLTPIFAFMGNPSMRFSQITDGLSNTLAVAESSYPGRNGARWPQWIGSTGVSASIFKTMPYGKINCVTTLSGRYWMTATGDHCALSFHQGIAHFLFFDGAVRALPESIDDQVYRSLGSPDSGESVSLDF